MWIKNRFIIFSIILFSSSAHALEFFIDPLYWRATEPVDWAFSNNLNSSNQNITYRTITYHYTPGFRVGVGYESTWNSKLYYTRFYTKTDDSASGNLTSACLGGKLTQSNPSFFYQTGQVSSIIDFNMFDFDLGKRFYITDKLMLQPMLGLEGGWINQSIHSNFQGQISVTENIKNNFIGIGPKAGIEGKLTFLHVSDSEYSLVADFATSYLVGFWDIKDILQDTTPKTTNIHVSNRNFGALSFQGTVGINLDYKKLSIKLGYEMNDWLDQCQIFDDATGPHNNDLILQGLTLNLSYKLS